MQVLGRFHEDVHTEKGRGGLDCNVKYVFGKHYLVGLTQRGWGWKCKVQSNEKRRTENEEESAVGAAPGTTACV